MNATDLQKGLVDHLAQAGTPSTWVSCPKDLPGRVGAMTRCDVRFSPDNTVTAVLTTTQVNRDGITWEITGPELTKDQVTQRVAGLTSADAVACDSDLDGQPGDWVQCQVTKNGVTVNQTVEVNDVIGLSLDLGVTPAVPKLQTEDLLRNRLAADYGLLAETATCPGDLVGVTGTTMDCVVTAGGIPTTYILTVTSTRNGAMNFEYAPKPAPVAVPAPGVVPAPGEAPPQPAPGEGLPQPAPGGVVPQPAPGEGVPQTAPGQAITQLAPIPGATQPAAGDVFVQPAADYVTVQPAPVS